MRSESFYIPFGDDAKRSVARGRIYAHLTKLPAERPYVVLVSEKKPSRSNEQNSLLWALYDDALEIGGEKLAGFDKRDLHEMCLGEWSGWESILALNGRTRLKPLKRSSVLSKTDFGSFVDFVVRFFAGHGIVLKLPDDPM